MLYIIIKRAFIFVAPISLTEGATLHGHSLPLNIPLNVVDVFLRVAVLSFIKSKRILPPLVVDFSEGFPCNVMQFLFLLQE